MVGGLRLICALGLGLFVAAALWAQDGSSTTTSALAAPPKAKVEVVEETIHGRKIADSYRWLEDSNSAGTQEYVREQLAYTRSILDPLPGRAQIHERLKELLSIGTIGTPQIGWKKDNSGFYYTRHPKKGEVPPGEEVYHVKIFYHVVGSDPAKDPLIFGEGRKAEDVPQVQLADDDDRWLLITVFEGWAKSEMYLQDLKAGTAPVEITSGKNFLYNGEVFKGKLYILTNEGAPRFHAFVVDATNPKRENWKEIIPQTDAVLESGAILDGKIFAQYEKNASSLLKLFALEGKPVSDIPMPTIGSVTGIGGKWNRREAFFGFHSFTVPPSVYQVDLANAGGRRDAGATVGATLKPSLWDKVDAPGINPADYEVQQVWFTSKDGTKIPMFVFHKKGLELNGRNPTLLTGYGGFNISQTPSFVAGRYVWMEHGGVFAVANLRGGAEFGEDWHRAGMLDKKQNVFDDFISAAEFLIADKITDKDHLAIQGGSNGGFTMGSAVTQRPDLFRAVVWQVPLLDMLRYQNFQIAKHLIPEER